LKRSNEKTSKTAKTTDLVESDFGIRILLALRKIIRAVDIHSRMLASEYGITGPQLACLLAVVEKESITATEIADRISLSASTVIGILDRLESKELLQRERDTNDRRLIHIAPTAKGKNLAAQMPYPLKRPLNTALGKMTESEQKKAVETLEKLVKYMGAGSIDADPLLEIGTIYKKMDSGKSQ
jgi:DNA-binding MarR family transcriptional regulator